MQFGHALDCIFREILLANPCLGLVALMKLNISDGFYCIALNVDDIPKLGVNFPSPPGHKPLIAFPLILPMGWKNSPPIFSTATCQMLLLPILGPKCCVRQHLGNKS
jgi:hypothetical protein